MSSSTVNLPAGSSAAVALPAGDVRAPAVIIVHEWWGLNGDMREIAERFAAEGFLALAVDLYGGRSAKVREEAVTLMQELRTPAAMEVVRDAVRYLKGHPRCTGKVGITGFCLGGGMALAAACSVEGLSAIVPFYGIPPEEHADYTRVRAPVLAHFGAQDPLIPVERPRAVEAAIRAAGGEIELCLYDAGHAFMRSGDPEVHHAPSADLAWSRTLAFLRRHLA